MSSDEETQTAEKAVDQTTERADAAPADVKEVGLSIHDERDNMAEEAKTVAVKSTQDLISFSLGAPRDGADVEVDARKAWRSNPPNKWPSRARRNAFRRG